MVMIDASALSGSMVTVTMVWMVGSGQVEQLQLNATRFGRSSVRYFPVTRKVLPASSMSNLSVPPTRGSASTFRHRAGRGHIHSASRPASVHSSKTMSGGAGLIGHREPSVCSNRWALFEFADEEAHRVHGTSAAVRKFEEVYQPELAAGPVVFTDYLQLATNQSQ